MKRVGLAGALAATLLAGCAASESPLVGLPSPVPDNVTFHEPPADAPPAPVFELDLINGDVVDAASAWAERPMVLVFFETWCEICRDRQQEINELAEEYQDVILFLGVAGLSSEDEVVEYARENDVAYPVGIDAGGEIWLDYAVAEPPLVALITKDGKIVRGWPGGIDRDQLSEQIDQLLVENAG